MRYLLLFLLSVAIFPCEDVNYSCGESYKLHLTFDDGPHDYNTGKILDILKKEEVPATFFLQVKKLVNEQGDKIDYSGRRADLASKGIPNYYYYLLDRMKDEGHYIGSHAYEHWHHVDSYQSGENWKENLKRGNPDALQEYLAHKSQPLIRLPHGQGWFEQTSSNRQKREIAEEVMDYLESMGMLHVGWNIDSNDWRYKDLTYRNFDDQIESFEDTSAQDRHYLQGMVDQVCQNSGGIILMHDVKDINWRNLSCLVKGFKKVGHEFVNPEDLIGFERSWGSPLIGRKTMPQNICCSYFDSTISPVEEEHLDQFGDFIQYIASKYK